MRAAQVMLMQRIIAAQRRRLDNARLFDHWAPATEWQVCA